MCKVILNDIVKSVILDKKESTIVDTTPGLNDQGGNTKSMSKRDKESNLPEFLLEGGDAEGDAISRIKEGYGIEVESETQEHVKNKHECKICGKLNKSNIENQKHLSNTHSEYAISIAKEYCKINFQKPQQLHKCVSCDRNFFFYQTWEGHVKDCQTDLGIIGGGEENIVNLESSSEIDEDDNESDDSIVMDKKNKKIVTVKNTFFTEKHWGIDEDTNPAGINFKSRMLEFKKSAKKLKKICRKGSVKVVGELRIQVEDVTRKGSVTEFKVNISDPEGQGDVLLSIWNQNQKTKEITVQINSVKGNERRLVKLFALEFVKELIERISNGKPIEDFFKKGEAKVACIICNKMFAKEATLMIHMKCHIICQKCGKGFKKESELMGHVTSVHSSMSNSKNALNEVKTNTCEDCGHIAKTRKSLMMH